MFIKHMSSHNGFWALPISFKAISVSPFLMPIESFRSDGYTRVSLVACSAGILLLGILSVVYDQISLLAYGM